MKLPVVLNKLIVIALLVLSLAAGIIMALSASNNHRGVEKNVVYTLMLMSDDAGNIYKDPTHVPWAVTQYMPLNYLLASGANVVTGTTAEDGYLQFYKVSRILSLLYWLIFGWVLYTLLKKFNPNQILLNTALVVTMMVLPVIWLVNTRPDGLLLLFNLVTLFLVIKGLDAQKDNPAQIYKHFLAAGLFAAFAFLTKQDGLFLGALTGLYLLLHGKFKATGWFVLGGIVGVVAVVLVMLPFVDFGQWLANMTGGVNNGFFLYNAIDFALNVVRDHFIILFLAGVLFGAYHLFTTPIKTLLHTPFAYLLFVLAGLTALYGFSSFKNGSGANYLLSPLMVATVLIAYVHGRNRTEGTKAALITAAFTLLALLAIGKFYYVHAPYQYNLAKTGIDPEASVAVVDQIKDLKSQDEEFTFFSTTGFVILSFPQDAIFPHNDITRHADPNKAFPTAVREIEEGLIKYVISPYALHDEKIAKLAGVKLVDYYTFFRTIDGYNFYCLNRMCAPSELTY